MFKHGLQIGLLLFGMFFGAGNLIFPPSLGFMSGGMFAPAILGFLLSGIGMPVIALIIGGLVNNIGYRDEPQDLTAVLIAAALPHLSLDWPAHGHPAHGGHIVLHRRPADHG